MDGVDGIGHVLTGDDHHLVDGLISHVNGLAGIYHRLFDVLQQSFRRVSRRWNRRMNGIDGVGHVLTGDDHHLVYGLVSQINGPAGFSHGLLDITQEALGHIGGRRNGGVDSIDRVRQILTGDRHHIGEQFVETATIQLLFVRL